MAHTTNTGPRIAAVLIVKNEHRHLDACLRSLAWADEIVVYDTGSSDDTRDIARRHTEHVFHDPDWQGFGVARQRAQRKTQADWILMIDADERVSPELAAEIRAAVARAGERSVFQLPRLTWVFGRFIRHGGWYPDPVTRLYPNRLTHYDDALVHERLLLPQDCRVERLKQPLLHYSYDDIRHYLVKSAHYADHWARQQAGRGKRAGLASGLVHGLGCFLRMYVFKAGFLDGPQGFLLALLSAHSTLVKYAALWERGQPRPPAV